MIKNIFSAKGGSAIGRKIVRGFSPVELVIMVGFGALAAAALIYLGTTPHYMASSQPVNVKVKVDSVATPVSNRAPGVMADEYIIGAPGQQATDYIVSHDLFFQNGGAEGGAPVSATKYLKITSGTETISPLQECVPSPRNPNEGNCEDGKWISPSDKWVKSAGDYIYVFDDAVVNPDNATWPMPMTNPSSLYEKATDENGQLWNMDSAIGFTKEKTHDFVKLYGDRWVPPEMSPVGTWIKTKDLGAFFANLAIAGYLLPAPQTIISDLSDIKRPEDFSGEDIASLDNKTYVVEFTVPTSQFQEYALKNSLAGWLLNFFQMPPATLHAISPYLVDSAGNVLPPVNTYKTRGWFIKGDGIENDSDEIIHPLVIFTHGLGASVTGEDEISKANRKIAYNLVREGYNVLIYDVEGDGISEGWNKFRQFSPASPGVQLYVPAPTQDYNFGWAPSYTYNGEQVLKGLLDINTQKVLFDFNAGSLQYTGYEDPAYGKVYLYEGAQVVKALFKYPQYMQNPVPEFMDWDIPAIVQTAVPNSAETGNGVNIFHMLNQLAVNDVSGYQFTLKSLDPAGNLKTGPLLTDDAKDLPTTLFGIALGAQTSMKAMELAFDPPSGIANNYTGYNLRGNIDSDCCGASPKVYGDMFLNPMIGMTFDYALVDMFNTYSIDGDVHKSISKWPGYMGMKAIYDNALADGLIEAYNRCRGFKEFVAVKGWHDWGLFLEPNFSYSMKSVLKWIKQITLNDPSMDNTGTTSWAQQVQSAPDFDMATAPDVTAPPEQGDNKLWGYYMSL